MIAKDTVLVVDIDGTLCPIKEPRASYSDLVPDPAMLDRLRHMHEQGWHIILHTARGMRSHDGNTGRIAKFVGPTLLAWLDEHDVPFDELHMGKPWAGQQGFYIDDRAVRPREFLTHTIEELTALTERDRITASVPPDGPEA